MNSILSRILHALNPTRGRQHVIPIFVLVCMPLTLSFFVIPARAQSYDSELKLGLAAYKIARYEEAMLHFRKAIELAPTQMNAHLYLATSCSSQYIPGLQTKDNELYAEQAIDQYEVVLNSDVPKEQKLNSAKGIAYLYLNMKKWEEAKSYYQKALVFDPADAQPYYSLGVIDWTASYQTRMEARAELGIKSGENLDPTDPAQRKICDELRTKSTPIIEDGIENLNRAMQLRADYTDAMAYLNLMYREKADVECADLMARQEDLTTADHWVDEVLRIKKAQAEKSQHVSPPYHPTSVDLSSSTHMALSS